MTGRSVPRWRLVVFDLDGTLVNSERDLAAAINAVRKSVGRGPLSVRTVRSYIGDGITPLVRRSFPGLRGARFTQVSRAFMSEYGSRLLDTTLPYPGVRTMLRSLRGCRLAVLTNKPEAFARKILTGLGLADTFDLVWGGDTGRAVKPSPAPLLGICRKLKVPAAESVLIGDGRNDILTARAAGASSIAALYGYTPGRILCSLKPDHSIVRPGGLKDLLSQR